MIIFSFDTGHNLGWSIVDNVNKIVLQCGFKKIPEKISIEALCFETYTYVLHTIYPIRIKYLIDKVIIELPEYFDSNKGKIAAKTGKLLQVHASAISIFSACNPYFCNVQLKTPKQWKGQLTKKATQYRIKEILGFLPKWNEHILDSISMGFSDNKKLWAIS